MLLMSDIFVKSFIISFFNTKLIFFFNICKNVKTIYMMYTFVIYFMYSGDADGRLPVIGTRYCVEALGLTLKSFWRLWYHHNQVH